MNGVTLGHWISLTQSMPRQSRGLLANYCSIATGQYRLHRVRLHCSRFHHYLPLANHTGSLSAPSRWLVVATACKMTGRYRSWRLKARATAPKARDPPATLSTIRHGLFAAHAAPPDTNPLPKIWGTLPTRANQSARLVHSKHLRSSRSPLKATWHSSNNLLALAGFEAHLSTRAGGYGASGAPTTNKRT